MENLPESVQNFTSEQFLAVWSQLSRNQKRYVIACQEFPSKKEAAESIGLVPRTVYQWPDIVEQAVQLMADSVVEASVSILAEATAKAAYVKVAGLNSENEKIRQDSATEILDRAHGKPTQRSEHTGHDGADLRIVIDR